MGTARRPSILHPLIGTTFPNWLSILRQYGGINRMGYARAAAIWAGAIGGMPIRWGERCCFGPGMSRQKLDPPPVFIIGHWRSGTTNLHNHLLQDPQFGCVSFMHSLVPNGFLTLGKLLRWFLTNRLPETRPMDAVPAGLDEPMSEDFALGSITDLTHYHSYYFPQQADRIFRRTILFEGVSEREIERWGRHYLQFLRKIAYASGGRRLLLKNPAHTGRIPHLLKLFPNAKFIHVIRNPFPVYASTCKLLDKFLDLFSLQDYKLETVSEHVLDRYRLIMQRYLRDRDLIPEGQLLEIRHEDMVADPLVVLERIYGELQIPGFEEALPRLEQYVESLRDYQTNRYTFPRETTARIADACDFAFRTWGYEVPAAEFPASPAALAHAEQRTSGFPA